MEIYGPETCRNLKPANVNEVSDRVTGTSPSTVSSPKALVQYMKWRGTEAQGNRVIKVKRFKLHDSGNEWLRLAGEKDEDGTSASYDRGVEVKQIGDIQRTRLPAKKWD